MVIVIFRKVLTARGKARACALSRPGSHEQTCMETESDHLGTGRRVLGICGSDSLFFCYLKKNNSVGVCSHWLAAHSWGWRWWRDLFADIFFRGKCTYGDQCSFSHETSGVGLKLAPGASSVPVAFGVAPTSLAVLPGVASSPPRRNICRHWQVGRCTLGDQCNFQHGASSDDWGGPT